MIETIPWDGKRITRPGLYSRVPLMQYHRPDICGSAKSAEPSISSSGLRKINPDVGSLKHFYATWGGNPDRVEPPESRAFVIGRAVHHLLLGEPFFAKMFCIQPDEYVEEKNGVQSGLLKKWNNNAIPCRRWHADRAKEGRAPLTPTEVEMIKGMSTEVGRHPLAKEFLRGQVERSFFWKDKETGVWLKWRPDSMPTADLDFSDIKTCQSVRYPDLVRTLRDRAYYQQAALGRAACREILKQDMGTYTLLFIEKPYPHCVRDERLFDEDLDRGDRMNRACLRAFAGALKTGIWSGPGAGNEGNERLGLSQDARLQIDKRIQHEGLADGRD